MVVQERQREVSWHNKVWRALASKRLALCLLGGLALLMCLATLLPQPPGAMPQFARSTWFGAAQQKYGAAYPLLSTLGLLDLYHSPLFLSLVGALLVNTAACTLERARRLLRAGRRRAAVVGTLIAHVAVITLVLSVVSSRVWSWDESAVALASGGIHSLERETGLLLRNDALNIEKNSEGHLVQFSARLALLDGDRPLYEADVRPNAPFRGRGISVWLLSYEPGVHVTAFDDQNQPALLVDADGQQYAGVVSQNLSLGPASLSVPAAGLRLHLSALGGNSSGETFYLRVERPATGDVILAEAVSAGSQVHVDTIRVELTSAPYAVLRVKHDPMAGILLLSAATLVFGNSLSLFTRRERPT